MLSGVCARGTACSEASLTRDAAPRRGSGAQPRAPGWSFVFDPIFEDPAEPRWVRFCAELLPRARALGARPGGSQTKALGGLPGALPLPRALARQRFLTPFFRQFLVG